jgi:hypothetical protein
MGFNVCPGCNKRCETLPYYEQGGARWHPVCYIKGEVWEERKRKRGGAKPKGKGRTTSRGRKASSD